MSATVKPMVAPLLRCRRCGGRDSTACPDCDGTGRARCESDGCEASAEIVTPWGGLCRKHFDIGPFPPAA